MLITDRSLVDLDATELKGVLADRNDAFRRHLEHEQRSLTPTILIALAIAFGLIIGTGGLLLLLHTLIH